MSVRRPPLPPGPVLVSACLLGEACRYDGGGCGQELAAGLRKDRRVIPVCPEILGGLPVPRPPAEIVGGDGRAVLAGRARVLDRTGQDVTGAFRAGADAVLALAGKHGAAAAIFKERSPSCGVRLIHDGNFNGMLVSGQGVTTALLAGHGIAVWSEEDLKQVQTDGCAFARE